MSFQFQAKTFAISALLAGWCVVQAGPAIASVDGDKCASTVAKALAKCTKKAVGVHAKCYKATGEACASGDEDLDKALASARQGVRDKCAGTTAVTDAGYGSVQSPYTPSMLGIHVLENCRTHARLVSERTFGEEGEKYTAAATDDDKKCLLTAAKEAGKFLGKQFGVVSKCVEDGCSFDFSVAAGETVVKLNGKCPTFATLVGSDATTFIAAATAQIRPALNAPCDPLDTTRCSFPFPNDYFTVADAGTESGRRLTIDPNAMPRSLQPERWNEADGFSIGPMLLLNDVNIDLAMTGAAPITDLAKSLEADAPVVIIDALTGEKQLLWVERDVRGATIADQALIIRVGKNLQEGRRYIVAMRNMKDAAGAAVSAPAAFALYRDSTLTTILPVEARRADMEAMLTTLDGFGIAREELYLAWDFTTQSSESTSGRLLTMRDDAFAQLGSDAPEFTVVSTTSPGGSIFRIVNGTFQVPLYLTDAGIPGSTLNVDDDGEPVSNGEYTASFRCVIPASATTGGAAPAVPARISMYGHGLLGSHTEVTAGNVQAFASEHNIIFCATDWTGFENDDEAYVLQVVADFSLFPRFIDRQHQGIVNFLMLGRLMKHASGLASDAAFQVGGESMLDTSDLFYDGNSQGGILGGVLAAFSQDATRFSLGVPGMNYSTLLGRSVDFITFDGFLDNNYPLSTDRNLLLSLSQLIWDRTDPSGHINHVLSDPYDNTPAKKILYQVAFGDHQVAPVTVEVAARSNGASIHQPAVSITKVLPEVTPYYGIPAIAAYPFDGSAMVIWDSGNPAPPISNIYPEEITPADPEWADLGPCAQANDSDPHSCPRSTPAARTQKSEFLKTTGAIVDVCGGGACLAP